MTSFGRRAAELVREVRFAEPGLVPPHNDELVRGVLEETREHFLAIHSTARALQEAGYELETAPPKQATAIIVHHESVLRNKRMLLAYEHERMRRIKALRWQLGKKALPGHAKAALSPSEAEFLTMYDANLRAYMGRASGVGLNLALDPVPPRTSKVEVRVLKSYGKIATVDGDVDLGEGTCHLLWRDEAQALVAEGVLELVNDDLQFA